MNMKQGIFTFLGAWFFLFSFVSMGQTRKEYKIYPVNEREYHIDGYLNEAFWNSAEKADQFTQTLPNTGQLSNYATEVRLAYTDHSILVGARMQQPKSILSKQITARDELSNSNSDIFTVYFDTYDDHQNGFVFRVSSAGVQQDARLSDGAESGDPSWDAVWNSKVSIAENEWVVEMEIPFSALRFAHQSELSWGVNFFRLIRKLNENSYWNPIDVQKQGFLAQTGVLKGLKNIEPPVRLFLFPYLSTGLLQQQEGGLNKQRWMKSGGLDVKYGLNESFTLDLTLIPDFSQVISDNLVRNLSPFEQLLNENRPFFTEGTEMFNKADVFYSRRVGERPNGYYDVQYNYGDTSRYRIDKNPNVSTLYNGLKISGRNKHKLGIGLFNAIGAPMNAKVYDKSTDENLTIPTEPLTNYNVLVLDQALKGQSYINFTNTNRYRQGNATDANVSSLIFNLFNKKETHSLSLISKLSTIHAADYKLGTAFGVVFSKISGKLTYTAYADRQSPNFDKTDMGIQFDFNKSSQSININYFETQPKSQLLQFYKLGTSHVVTENSVPFAFRAYEGSAFCFLLFKSFWDLTYSINSKPITPTDYYQLRGFGKLLKTYPYVYQSIDGSSDSRKKLFWGFAFGFGIANSSHTEYVNVNQIIRYRFSPKLEMTLEGGYVADNNNIGFAYYDNKLNEPIVGNRDVKEYTGELSFKLNLSPTMNFTGRFRHYNSYIRYNTFHRTESNGEWRNNRLAFRNDLNENYNLQNVDLFYNWIFKPGSRIVVSYKQWLNDAYILNDRTETNYIKNVSTIIRSPHAYEFSIRFIYFLDYSQLPRPPKRYM